MEKNRNKKNVKPVVPVFIYAIRVNRGENRAISRASLVAHCQSTEVSIRNNRPESGT